MKTLPPFLALCLVVILGPQANAQIDPIFIQPSQVALKYNPAFAGMEDKGRLTMAYSDWGLPYRATLRGAFVSWDQPVAKLHGGLGVNIGWDQVDGYGSLFLELAYAYRIRLGEKLFLQPSMSLSLNQAMLPQDPTYPGENFATWRYAAFFPNMKLGLVCKGERFYVGLSGLNFNHPEKGDIRRGLPVFSNRLSFNAMGGYYFRPKSGSKWELALHGMVDYGVTKRYLAQLNAHLRYKRLLIGVGAMGFNRASGMIGFENKWLRATYSSMVNVAYPRKFFVGWAHELSLSVFLPTSK